MMKPMPKKVTTNDIFSVFSMVNNSKQINFSMESFQNSSWLVKAVMIVLLLMVGGGVGWFFLYHQIAPLMLVIAITIPILCIGIAQQNRTILRIIKEWGEYKAATDSLIELISLAEFDPETSEKILTAINWVQDESDDLDTILVEIGDTAQELLDAATEAVKVSANIAETSSEAFSNSPVKPNIIPKDETEDLSITI